MYYKPMSLNLLYIRFVLEYLLERPDLLSQLRPLGLDLFNTHLQDFSVKFDERQRRKTKRQLAYLRSFENSNMSSSQRLSYNVLEYFTNESLNRQLSETFFCHHYLINQLFGAQTEIIALLTKYHRIKNIKEAEAYLLRVQRISLAFDQLIEQQKKRRENGIETPRFVLERVVNDLKIFRDQLSTEPNQSPLVFTFVDKLKENNLPLDKRSSLITRLLTVIKTFVIPAYARLITMLENELSRSTTDHGVYQLPSGDIYYRLCLQFHTTTDMTPDEIHQLGLTQVDKIQKQIKTNVIKELEKDPIHQYNKHDVENSRKQILDD
ncbi:unnamed protein product, partial [Didymodactylos carnosus]